MKVCQRRGTLWLMFCFMVMWVFSYQTGVTADSKWIEEAKKEGSVVWYTSMELGQANHVAGRFKEKYPFIKVDVLRTGGGPLMNRILAEARGGKHSWDVAVGRGEMILPLLERKLLASYRSPETSMIFDDLVDREGFWIAYYANPPWPRVQYTHGLQCGRPRELRSVTGSEVEREKDLARYRRLRPVRGTHSGLGEGKGSLVF